MSLNIEHAEHVTVQIGSSSAGRDFLATLLGTAAGAATKAPAPIPTNPTPLDAVTVPVKPGELWAGQGWYAGICSAPDGTRWHLMVPERARDELRRVKWGGYGTEIPGAASIYDGQANTADMVTAGSELAKAVQAVGEGCYLPSRAEALLMFATLKDQLGEDPMWTSTQYSANDAWCQYFGSGFQYIHDKVAVLRAVAVRRLML
jgi:hypothetical protein